MLLRSGEYTTTQYNNSRYKMRNSKNVSFTGNPTRKIVDAAKKKITGVFLSQKVEYNDAEKLINDIDALLGENFFRNKIDKSNAKILQNGKLTYEDAGLLKLTAEAFKNITYDLYYKTLAKIKEEGIDAIRTEEFAEVKEIVMKYADLFPTETALI